MTLHDLPELSPESGTHSPAAPDPAAAHLDAIGVEGDHLAEPEAEPAGAGLLTPEQFREGLAAAFGLSGGLLGLETLTDAPRRASFGPAAAALYETAHDTPWLRFLIAPESVWLQRAIALGAFAVPVGAGVVGELRERRQAAAEASSEPDRAAA